MVIAEGIKYYYDVFTDLKSFDIVPYKTVVDKYLKIQTLLELEGKEKSKATHNRPINSDIEVIDKHGFWNGFSPLYFNVNPLPDKVVPAKADVVSMDMVGYGRDWDHFIYLSLPYEFFLQSQTAVHSNPDVSLFNLFLDEVESKNLQGNEILDLQKEYDLRYPEPANFKNFFRVDDTPKWRADLEIGQYISIRNSGLIYPICFNSKKHILQRGSHRALFCARTHSNVPILLFHQELGGIPTADKQIVELGNHFGQPPVTMEIHFNLKKLVFRRENNIIYSTI